MTQSTTHSNPPNHSGSHHHWNHSEPTNPLPTTDSPHMTRQLPSDWQRRRRDILQRDDYTCRNCERHREMRGVSLEVHHIIPRSRGGSHEAYNLITLCQHCHDRAHNGNIQTPEDPLGYFDRLKEEVRSFRWRQANITNFDSQSIARTVAGSVPTPTSMKSHTSLRSILSTPPKRSLPDFIMDVGSHVTDREATCAE